MHCSPCGALPLALASLVLTVTLPAQNAPAYHVTHRYTLGGDGGWDYLTYDTAGKRLFIVRSDRVMVVDPSGGSVVGEIPGLHRGHGVALAERAGHGFVTSGADSTVTMFDLRTLRVLGTTKVDDDDDAILYDPASDRVVTFNGDAGTASVLDPVSGQRVGTVTLDGKPEFGVSAGDGKLYVNIEDKAELAEIDARAIRVTRRWSLAPCESPTGLAIDVAHKRLFSGCQDRVMTVSDYAAGRVVTTIPIDRGVDANRFDPDGDLAFSSNGEGTITVAHEDAPDHFTVVQTVETMRGARTMTLDPVTHRLFTVSAEFGPVPAAATPDNPRRRPPLIPGTFTLLVVER